MPDFPFKAPPMDHQRDCMRKMWKMGDFALFHEMGTGKTFTVINVAAARHMANQIRALLVICPTPIKLVWESEFEKWCPIPYKLHVLEANESSRKEATKLSDMPMEELKVLVVGVEALSQGKAYDIAHWFVHNNSAMCVADESSRLKNAKANRTKRAITIAQSALYRVIMTGTPITQGMEDLYGQFQFLNPKIIGCKSFFQFRNRYCILGGFEGKQVLGYQNTNELMRRVSPYVDIIKKDEVLDLPPKVYERIIVEPTAEQKRLIKSLVDTFEAESGEHYIVTETILERLTRFQQIIGGHFPFNEDDGTYGVKPIEGTIPKLAALLEVLDELPNETKVIIWTRFTPEANLILNTLREQYGSEKVTSFLGQDDPDQRREAVRSFQDGEAQFMVSNPQLGGMGQTWTSATAVIYYSNSFSYEDRRQSEDRAHRKGQTNKVTYIDIEVKHRYDQMILKAIGLKGDVAKFVDQQITHHQEGHGRQEATF